LSAGSQVAAVLLTGGAAGIGTYYALQYDFYGLRLVLDLRLLGVSRDFELSLFDIKEAGLRLFFFHGFRRHGPRRSNMKKADP
jgi:hypothetical protein